MLQKNGETIAGVVYDVMRDVVYSAEKNNGSFENERRISVSKNANLGHSVHSYRISVRHKRKSG